MDAELFQLDERRVMALYGPMRLTIEAWTQRQPDIRLASEAGRFAFSLLPRIAPAVECFRQLAGGFGHVPAVYEDPLLTRMVRAVRRTGKKDLGPLAAVAGVVAETTALWLRDAGASKAIVENGGDLAVYLHPGETAVVGIRKGITDPHPSCALTLSGDKRLLWGVASSGFGGRGLTQGIADAAMCVAAQPAEADAAATAVAAACRVDSPAVAKAFAETLQPGTDIPGFLVTRSVGPLGTKEIHTALERALDYAQYLVNRNVILGALVCLRGHSVLTRNFTQNVSQLQPLFEKEAAPGPGTHAALPETQDGSTIFLRSCFS